MDSYNICPFVPGLFHLGHLHGSYMLQHMWEFPSFSRLNNILLSTHATFRLPIHVSVDFGVVSTFWLLWIILLWSMVCNYLFWVPIFSSFEYIYPVVELVDHMITVMFLRNRYTVLHSSCTILHSHQQWAEVAVFIHSCQHLFYFISLYVWLVI